MKLAQAWIREIGEHEGQDGARAWAALSPERAAWAMLDADPERDERDSSDHPEFAEAARIVVEHFRALAGQHLRAAREAADLTARQLGEAAGLTENSVLRIERGEMGARRSTWIALDAALRGRATT